MSGRGRGRGRGPEGGDPADETPAPASAGGQAGGSPGDPQDDRPAGHPGQAHGGTPTGGPDGAQGDPPAGRPSRASGSGIHGAPGAVAQAAADRDGRGAGRRSAAPRADAPAPLDDARVADHLAAHPDFFDRRPDALARLALRHRHGGRAVSLIERQVDVLREKNSLLERRIAELVRTARDNDTILDRLQALVRAILLARDDAALPAVIEAAMREHFKVPQVALRLWRVDDGLPAGDTAPTEPAVIEQTASLPLPYCGAAEPWRAAALLSEAGADTRSIALVPLRVGAHPRPFGLLALGSADTGRFASDLGVAFLARIGEVVSAALTRQAAMGGAHPVAGPPVPP